MIQQLSGLMLVAALLFSTGTSSMGKEIKQVAQDAFEQPYLAVTPTKSNPGDVVLVKSNHSATVSLFDHMYRLQPSAGEYVRFIPVPFNAKTGTHTIQTQDQKHSATLTILPKEFKVDRLTVSQQLNSMRQDTARIDADQKKINAARSKSAETAYFTDKFLWPAEGRITTPYGYQRVVNGVPANRHAAIDIANKTGTPIVATNNGRVVLADSLYLTGNTVIIDHGLQVFSIYAHMSKIQVKTGDEVKAGQQIGQIGSTGFSTGPHLHFGMLIGNTYVNPQPFLEASPFLWE
ncbi:M23 family metallopeptidase [Brevibacillus ruminantium]|uniref:M23 family metallopeptidase n=1 Tax=Brevibacillus ruminantium TaxID=2950604 RepID=A0ABY4WN15_9BACL|nr:M23 family metallopeptidase [Brevibacillus ruminantium]USG68244.1 M23 family metallopeptidase [Brevibacillus ruminantium]